MANRLLVRRRDVVEGLLALAALGAWSGLTACAGGSRGLPPGRSVWLARGAARVGGRAADTETRIGPGDTIETGEDGELVFAVGDAAFYARPGSSVRLDASSEEPDRVGRIRLESGGLLSVFGRRAYRVETPLAVVAIRGTGLYAAVETAADYICTCYGRTRIMARADPASSEEIASSRHDAPRYVTASGPTGRRIEPAPFKDHTDAELRLLESLVGRTTPFPVNTGRAGSGGPSY